MGKGGRGRGGQGCAGLLDFCLRKKRESAEDLRPAWLGKHLSTSWMKTLRVSPMTKALENHPSGLRGLRKHFSLVTPLI
jgi:hypothetical protein